MSSKSLSFLPLNNPPPFSPSSSASQVTFSLLPPCSVNRNRTTRWKCRIMVSSQQSFPPIPDDGIVVGCGGASMDYLVMVDGFPKPDEKIKGACYKVQGGGNVGNALTCAARLGLKPRIIAKVAEDSEGRAMLEEFEADGVDTSFAVVSKEGRSMFSYVIVDSEKKTRTAIYHPGYPPMIPADISSTTLSSALEDARLVYFDGLSLKTALVVAEERSQNAEDARLEEVNVDECYASLNKKKDFNMTHPTCLSSPVLKLVAHGIGTLNGRLLVGTAEKIPPSELVDTTGAGDAFIGAILYSLCAETPPEKMLPFAAKVAAGCCRKFGARTGLPRHTDPHLKQFIFTR